MADPVALARRVLGDNGYLDTYRLRPRLDLEALLKGYGLEWHRHPFKVLGGALILFDDECFVITNSRFSRARQRFAAAHELGHYLMHRGRPLQRWSRAATTQELQDRANALWKAGIELDNPVLDQDEGMVLADALRERFGKGGAGRVQAAVLAEGPGWRRPVSVRGPSSARSTRGEGFSRAG